MNLDQSIIGARRRVRQIIESDSESDSDVSNGPAHNSESDDDYESTRRAQIEASQVVDDSLVNSSNEENEVIESSIDADSFRNQPGSEIRANENTSDDDFNTHSTHKGSRIIRNTNYDTSMGTNVDLSSKNSFNPDTINDSIPNTTNKVNNVAENKDNDHSIASSTGSENGVIEDSFEYPGDFRADYKHSVSNIVEDNDKDPENPIDSSVLQLPALGTLLTSTILHNKSNESCLNCTDDESDVDTNAVKVVRADSAQSIICIDSEEEVNVKQSLTQKEFQNKTEQLKMIETELQRLKNTQRVIKLDTLPDNGKSLQGKIKTLENQRSGLQTELHNAVVEPEPEVKPTAVQRNVWTEIDVEAVGPRTFGKKGIQKFNIEKKMAVETLDNLHKSLDTCPDENQLAEDPQGLKVTLMTHQKRALVWLLWREKQEPSGGLLADDMGLGKTLTMISLIMASKQLEQDQEDNKENMERKYSGGTLVVCPASVMNQWDAEITNKTRRGMLDVELYHGAAREHKAKRLASHDVVLTTYSVLMNENKKGGTAGKVYWRRIILDEAHQIRNYKSQTAVAICELAAKSRWTLTGTPVHNKELDLYSLLKFLRCSPFDNLPVWKHWVNDKSTGGQARLHALISSLMLRRTKAELIERGSLQTMPSKTWALIPITLDRAEMDVYQRVLIFSKTLFAQFLHQRAEKNQDASEIKFSAAGPNQEYFKMRDKLLRMNRVKEVAQHEILVLLLRLRQICCHPSLITQMLEITDELNDSDQQESEEMNLLDQLNKLNINDDTDEGRLDPVGLSDEKVGLKDASKGFLKSNNPVFAEDRCSTKIKVVIEVLKSKVSTGDKAIIVSQWRSLLNLVSIQLNIAGIKYTSLDGSVPVNKRMPIVNNINDPNSDTKVLLLSLTAGGVGLNLIGANHLFLLDLHWNPQLEKQAQDRVYRMGQTKDIYIYKFMATGTIEERIKCLQDIKLNIADCILTGSKNMNGNKLSLQDLKLLFDFK